MASIPVLKGAGRKIPTAERHDLSFYCHCERHRRVAIRSPLSLRTSPQTGVAIPIAERHDLSFYGHCERHRRVAIPIAERRNLPTSTCHFDQAQRAEKSAFPIIEGDSSSEDGFSVPAGRCGHRPLQLKGEKRIPTGMNALGMTKGEGIPIAPKKKAGIVMMPA